MNDLELMELLEKNGYEPSLDNLMILKEALTPEQKIDTEDALHDLKHNAARATLRFADKYGITDRDEIKRIRALGASDNLKASRKRQKALRKEIKHLKKAKNHAVAANLEASPENSKAYGGLGTGEKNTDTTAADQVKTDQKAISHFGIRRNPASYFKRKDFSRFDDQADAVEGEIVKKERDLEWRDDTHSGLKAGKIPRRGDWSSLLETVSDYELYQILDENGYATTEENLFILKEGLQSGEYEIF